MQNIALIGFMGSGKTTIGKELAHQLGWTFWDSDRLIQDTEKCAIPEIFEKYGEAYFRQCERTILTEVAGFKKIVLATGGGLPIGDENWEILNRYFLTVYLKVDFQVLCKRIMGDKNRPLLRKYPSIRKLKELYDYRLRWYERAHVIIDTTHKKIDMVLGEIIERAKSFDSNSR